LSLQRKRVVVIESDDIVLALALHVLKRQGFDVDTASDAAAARALLARKPDIVVADARLVEPLRDALAPIARHLIITGRDGEISDAACAVIRKPIEVDVLVSTVARCAGVH
jgi:DNA-binding NtrC family response regulator